MANESLPGGCGDGSNQTIVLGGGCFWCTEAVFSGMNGITDVESGYAQGHVDHPTYEQVCSGGTGHNEVVKLTFDPQQVSLRQVLDVFFAVHDPTTLNRQGNDVGSQYRSGIYYLDDAQREIAVAAIDELAQSTAGGRSVVTEVAPLANYSTAEDYHQRYVAKHPNQGYCAMVAAPKVEKFRRAFKDLVRL